MSQTNLDHFEQLLSGQNHDPRHLLGPHSIDQNGSSQAIVRSFLPNADQAWIISPVGGIHKRMNRIHHRGLFEVTCDPHLFDTCFGKYQIRYKNSDCDMTVHDPYAFDSLLSEEDLYLFGEGNNLRLYDHLGAHLRTVDGVVGVHFAVWAPNAKSVSLVGDFNGWDGHKHLMQKRIPSGIWELFIPGIKQGALYKFRIHDARGRQFDKCDPMGFAAELPPRTANLVVDLDQFDWGDQNWMKQRREIEWLEQPMSVYEVHLGSWRQDHDRHNGWMNYRDLAHQLVDHCRQHGFTHVELLPVSEHPFTGSWGYQTVGYYAVTSRYGTPEDFMYFVNYCHENQIGVIIDWVPAHFPKDAHGLARFDGTSLYEHQDPRQGLHPDWDTLIFNYGRNEVRNFLVANALFWLDKYHIDGLRVDAVASMLYLDYSRKDGEWIPNEYGGRENLSAIHFLKQTNEKVHELFPGAITIAEESTAWGGVSRPTYCGGLGFSFKWNMGWMNDTLRYMRCEPVHRKYHHDELTFSLIYAFTENFVSSLSHDEVVHGKGSLLDKMPGDHWQKFANLRLLYSYMWSHPGKKLLFMGGEFGQWNEWNCNQALQWELTQYDDHAGLQRLIADLNRLYCEIPALHQLDFESAGFEWIDCTDHQHSVLSYVRLGKDPDDMVLVVCNFTPVVRKNYRIGVPAPGRYSEIFNSDSIYYAGTNVGNGSGIQTEALPWHGRQQSMEIVVPPLATVMFQPDSK